MFNHFLGVLAGKKQLVSGKKSEYLLIIIYDLGFRGQRITVAMEIFLSFFLCYYKIEPESRRRGILTNFDGIGGWVDKLNGCAYELRNIASIKKFMVDLVFQRPKSIELSLSAWESIFHRIVFHLIFFIRESPSARRIYIISIVSQFLLNSRSSKFSFYWY